MTIERLKRMNDCYVATYLSMIHRSAEVTKWSLRNHASVVFSKSMPAPEAKMSQSVVVEQLLQAIPINI
jgi:hypothetical protein